MGYVSPFLSTVFTMFNKLTFNYRLPPCHSTDHTLNTQLKFMIKLKHGNQLNRISQNEHHPPIMQNIMLMSTRQGGEGVGRLSRSLFDACVDLNPHQIEAALFAVRSPVSKGVLLADEVGLGKTIEAGIVLCEYWAERKRKLLVICPASIRKQWALELSEKFNLSSEIIDAKSYKESKAAGNPFPFDSKYIVIKLH